MQGAILELEETGIGWRRSSFASGRWPSLPSASLRPAPPPSRKIAPPPLPNTRPINPHLLNLRVRATLPPSSHTFHASLLPSSLGLRLPLVSPRHASVQGSNFPAPTLRSQVDDQIKIDVKKLLILLIQSVFILLYVLFLLSI